MLPGLLLPGLLLQGEVQLSLLPGKHLQAVGVAVVCDLYALVLILSPVELPTFPSADLYAALRRQSDWLELSDHHTSWRPLAELSSEACWCRLSWCRMRGLPPDADAARFAWPASAANAELSWIGAAWRHAETAAQVETWRADAWRSWQSELDHQREVWSEVSMTQQHDIQCRRRALGRLQELLGLRSYYEGKMP
jgi:hypothetical protein